jgi:hypothetical protein
VSRAFRELRGEQTNVTEGFMSRSLIVLPDDTGKPILDAIATAKKSLRIKMFLFSDPAFLEAVIGRGGA